MLSMHDCSIVDNECRQLLQSLKNAKDPIVDMQNRIIAIWRHLRLLERDKSGA